MAMRQTMIPLNISTTTSISEKEFTADRHFKWDSIAKFVYLSYAFSSSTTNFDLFSKVLHDRVRIIEFIFFEVIIGMTYMFMDFFIKQYTRKLDFNKAMNPLLRGVTMGILLQTAICTLIQAGNLADALRFLASSFLREPCWTKCPISIANVTCMIPKAIIMSCYKGEFYTDIETTSAHFNYIKSFSSEDRTSLSMRFYVIAVVWLSNFFISTITEESFMKLCKISCLWRIFSLVMMLCQMLLFDCDTFFKSFHVSFQELFDLKNVKDSDMSSVMRVAYAFGVGLIGVYDFGMMSPFTMIDNAVIIFTVVYTATAFVRSLIVQEIHLVMSSCVQLQKSVSAHYLIFAVLPLGTEFMDAHKIYVICMYLNLMAAFVVYLALLTLSLSKLLHSEFLSVKNVYIVGVLCLLGFIFSVPLGMLSSLRMNGLTLGMNITALYLGGVKVAIVMWVYGVQRFSNDIHFWLGFKPTKFWTICWRLLPIVLMVLMIQRIVRLVQLNDMQQKTAALLWIIIIVLAVTFFEVKTISRYLLCNNLAAAFQSSPKYGPPDPDDRKRRRKFNAGSQHQQCGHNCFVMDESYLCNHMPLIFKSKVSPAASESSTTNIYEATTRKRMSSIVNIPSENFN